MYGGWTGQSEGGGEQRERESSKCKASEDLKYRMGFMEKGTELNQRCLTLDYLTRATQR